MILFYSEDCDGEHATLVESEAIHCRVALRKNLGDMINITDGRGNGFEGQITKLGKKVVEVQILKTIELSKIQDFHIHVAIAPTKNISRFEWFLEKATELGISEITPILCSRSERKIIKEERLKKILVSAMKQSLKSKMPKLNPLTKLTDFLKQEVLGQCFIAHLEEDPALLIKSYTVGSDVVILIGPEGDFTLEEIAEAKKASYKSVSLGEYRLRTETAGIAAVQSIHFANLI